MSTLLTLRTLAENQLSLGTTNASSNPSVTLLNSYINTAIRKIVRRDKPRELLSATVSSVNIVADANTVSIPTGILVPNTVYYKYSSGYVARLRTRRLKDMINIETARRFFDTANTGDPTMYDVRGTSLLFNKYFSRSDVGAIKIYGLSIPTTLVADGDETELPVDYDMLITYQVGVVLYQKLDDSQNQQKFQNLADREREMLKFNLDANDEESIVMDPDTFIGDGAHNGNEGIFFTN